jgi:hypothetical protein
MHWVLREKVAHWRIVTIQYSNVMRELEYKRTLKKSRLRSHTLESTSTLVAGFQKLGVRSAKRTDGAGG